MKIWTQATTVTQASGNTVMFSVVASALNEMFDITTTHWRPRATIRRP